MANSTTTNAATTTAHVVPTIAWIDEQLALPFEDNTAPTAAARHLVIARLWWTISHAEMEYEERRSLFLHLNDQRMQLDGGDVAYIMNRVERREAEVVRAAKSIVAAIVRDGSYSNGRRGAICEALEEHLGCFYATQEGEADPKAHAQETVRRLHAEVRNGHRKSSPAHAKPARTTSEPPRTASAEPRTEATRTDAPLIGIVVVKGALGRNPGRRGEVLRNFLGIRDRLAPETLAFVEAELAKLAQSKHEQPRTGSTESRTEATRAVVSLIGIAVVRNALERKANAERRGEVLRNFLGIRSRLAPETLAFVEAELAKLAQSKHEQPRTGSAEPSVERPAQAETSGAEPAPQRQAKPRRLAGPRRQGRNASRKDAEQSGDATAVATDETNAGDESEQASPEVIALARRIADESGGLFAVNDCIADAARRIACGAATA